MLDASIRAAPSTGVATTAIRMKVAPKKPPVHIHHGARAMSAAAGSGWRLKRREQHQQNQTDHELRRRRPHRRAEDEPQPSVDDGLRSDTSARGHRKQDVEVVHGEQYPTPNLQFPTPKRGTTTKDTKRLKPTKTPGKSSQAVILGGLD